MAVLLCIIGPPGSIWSGAENGGRRAPVIYQDTKSKPPLSGIFVPGRRKCALARRRRYVEPQPARSIKYFCARWPAPSSSSRCASSPPPRAPPTPPWFSSQTPRAEMLWRELSGVDAPRCDGAAALVSAPRTSTSRSSAVAALRSRRPVGFCWGTLLKRAKTG